MHAVLRLVPMKRIGPVYSALECIVSLMDAMEHKAMQLDACLLQSDMLHVP